MILKRAMDVYQIIVGQPATVASRRFWWYWLVREGQPSRRGRGNVRVRKYLPSVCREAGTMPGPGMGHWTKRDSPRLCGPYIPITARDRFNSINGQGQEVVLWRKTGGRDQPDYRMRWHQFPPGRSKQASKGRWFLSEELDLETAREGRRDREWLGQRKHTQERSLCCNWDADIVQKKVGEECGQNHGGWKAIVKFYHFDKW